MNVSALLAQPHLSVIARDADSELAQIQAIVEHQVRVDGRGELEELLGRLLGAHLPPTPKTLDLIGGSMPETALLSLGGWVIDTSRLAVTAFFHGLAELEVLPRLGVHTVRLLGCETARTRQGRAAICKLSEILGLEVLGATQMLSAAHYDARGLRDNARHLLLSSAELRIDDSAVAPRYPRPLDIDALPASPLGASRQPWPRRLASGGAARDVLGLVRRTAGAALPGFAAPPECELVLPSGKPGWYHLVQVLLDGELVRVYPDGEHRPGVVYPVDDPRALRALVERLPPAPGAAR